MLIAVVRNPRVRGKEPTPRDEADKTAPVLVPISRLIQYTACTTGLFFLIKVISIVYG